jgi:predicted Zn-ribbon and HTH transcriptional regulator
MFNRLYDGATHYCKDCGWAGDGWELKGDLCPTCKSKNVEEFDT